jgi:hypothetical protein
MTTSLEVIRAAPERPARFEAYPPEVMRRAYEVWSTIAGRSGARVVRVLAREYGEEVALPTPSTVNRWASEEAWASRATADLHQSQGKSLYELQVAWLAAVQGAVDVILDAETGAYDGDPAAGAIRLKAAELAMRPVERGVISLVPSAPPPSELEDVSALSVEEREARIRNRVKETKARR